MDMHSSWLRVGLRLYDRMVFLGRVSSRIMLDDGEFTYNSDVLHQRSIANAASSIGERIGLAEVGACASLLVINTKDHEAFVGHGINEVLAFDNDWVGSGDGSGESAESGDVVGELRCR
jgi:hypothetical protein